MTKAPMTSQETYAAIRNFVEQRKWDYWVSDEEAQAHPQWSRDDEVRFQCYQEILDLLDGKLDPDFMSRVYDRARRRQIVGPR